MSRGWPLLGDLPRFRRDPLAFFTDRARLHLVPGQRLELDASITLRPRHGIPMTLQRTGVSSLQSTA